jgi:hypothetical protein
MSNEELQEEEREVLLSIYDGDPAFKNLSPTKFQYKVIIKYKQKNFYNMFFQFSSVCLLCIRAVSNLHGVG